MKKFWLIDLIVFQSAWWLCALYSYHASPIVSALLIMRLIISPTRKHDLMLLPVALIGILFDQIMISNHIIVQQSDVIPMWLILLWCFFILTFNHSLAWLAQLPLAAKIASGALFGPLSYYSASLLGAISLSPKIVIAMIFYSIFFALLLPGILFIQQKLIHKGAAHENQVPIS